MATKPKRAKDPTQPKRPSGKVMRDAIMLALNDTTTVDGEKKKNIYHVARALVKEALKGDVPAIREINERIDGKVAQALATEPDSPVQIEIIRRVLPEV